VLGVLVVVPIILILYFSVTTITEQLNILKELRPLEQVSQLSSKVGEYVHEMQKERGATGGFMGSDGAEFVDVLRDQRQLTNVKRRSLDVFLNTFNPEDFGEKFVNIFNIAFAEYNKLSELRAQISGLSISDSEGIDFYTQHNSKMLDVVRLVSSQTSPDVKLTEDINAYIIFIEGKEKAGEERALMTNTFASDMFGDGAEARFLFLVHSQDIYFDAFTWYANQEQIDFFKERMSDPSVNEAERIREIAFSRTEDFNIDALHWFLSATARIDLMQDTANKILVDIIKRADLLKKEINKKLQFAVLGMVGILFVTIFLSIYLVNFLSRRIRVLSEGASIIGKGDLNYKVGTTYKDELGDLSREFDKMTLAIKKSQREIDQKVKEQTEVVLEKKKEADNAIERAEAMNDAMTGRELKMIELKKEIADLKDKNNN
jgi:methyl-accepting chemotaxis protein